MFAFVDDFLISCPTVAQGLVTLEKLFSVIRDVNVRLNGDKCQFFVTECVAFGWHTKDGQLKVPQERLNAFQKIAFPRTRK